MLDTIKKLINQLFYLITNLDFKNNIDKIVDNK